MYTVSQSYSIRIRGVTNRPVILQIAFINLFDLYERANGHNNISNAAGSYRVGCRSVRKAVHFLQNVEFGYLTLAASLGKLS